jgi:dienelactone hydrolase
VVIFAHGSGSSRHSPRNQAVARGLQQAGFATLLADLLTRDEEVIDERTRHFRFDIDLLARRVLAVREWLASDSGVQELPAGYFGASTGAAAALVAAARRPDLTRAIVSRGGRPDLAGEWLGSVAAPTLLIVGGLDIDVIALNRQALASLPGTSVLEIIPGATHLFPEPGTLERVTKLAGSWFTWHLAGRPAAWRPSTGW